MAHSAAALLAALVLGASVFAHNVALRLLLLALGLALAGWVSFRQRGRVDWLPPVWLPFALWAAWAAASGLWSVDPERTLKEWRNEVFYTGSMLWMCYVAAQARDAARFIVPVLALAAVAVCAVGLWDFSHGARQYRRGWHGGPGDHSSALLMLMPCAVMAGWYLRRTGAPAWQKWALWALVPLFFAGAYGTLNRTVWVGFAAQFALIGAFLAARGGAQTPAARARRTRIAAGVLVGLLAAGLLLVNLQSSQAPKGESRLALWSEIGERIGEAPLAGHGFGRGLLAESLQEELRSVSRNLWHAHNLFLDTVLQTGVVGLVLLLLLLGAVGREAWRAVRSADVRAAACGVALMTMLAGMVVRNMTDTLLARQNALLFWGLVGVLLAWSATAGASRRR
jgi:O-antigen ligase